MLKAIIVDDEQLAITTLQNKLAQFSEVEVVKTYACPSQFDMEELQRLQVNVAFLDIEMGTITGLDLADMIHSRFPHIHIVFVTAYAEYAVQAFEVNSLDYLLKPVTTPRLRKTMSRLTKQLSQTTQEQSGPFVVECFKEFQLFQNGKPIPFKTSKVKELFAFFMMHRNTPVHRDILIESLWPNQDYKKSKVNLHTCISHLRKMFTSFGYDQPISFRNQSYTFTIEEIQNDADQFLHLAKNIDVVDDETEQQASDCITLSEPLMTKITRF